jgi:predicted nuclease of predicted toxin-antitoxin system
VKLLLDENLPQKLRGLLFPHEVSTVTYMHWNGMKNGALLRAAADGGFDALITLDSNLSSQQNLKTLPLAVVVLRARSNKLDDVVPLIPRLLETLSKLEPRTFVVVE